MSNQHNNGEAQVLGFRDCMSFCIGQIIGSGIMVLTGIALAKTGSCLLYTSDAADE